MCTQVRALLQLSSEASTLDGIASAGAKPIRALVEMAISDGGSQGEAAEMAISDGGSQGEAVLLLARLCAPPHLESVCAVEGVVDGLLAGLQETEDAAMTAAIAAALAHLVSLDAGRSSILSVGIEICQIFLVVCSTHEDAIKQGVGRH